MGVEVGALVGKFDGLIVIAITKVGSNDGGNEGPGEGADVGSEVVC